MRRDVLVRALAELLTTEQVAELAGVSRHAVQVARQRGGFPEPDAVIGRTPVWFRATVERHRQK